MTSVAILIECINAAPVPKCLVSLTCHSKETAEDRTACGVGVEGVQLSGAAAGALEAGLPVCIKSAAPLALPLPLPQAAPQEQCIQLDKARMSKKTGLMVSPFPIRITSTG